MIESLARAGGTKAAALRLRGGGPLLGAAVVLAFAALPLVGGDYIVSLMVIAGIYAILLIGLNLFMGYTGQVSFGHNAFAALGGYGTAILTATYDWPPVAALIVSAVIAAAAAAFIGAPTLRLRGHYLAMATLALGLIVYDLAGQLKGLTAGFLGIAGIPPFGIGDLALSSDRDYYYAIWILVALGLWIATRIAHSRVGRALAAIAGSEEAAAGLGVNVARYKLVSFTLSAVYASVAGSLLAHYVTFISPEVFGLDMITLLFTMLFVGGIGTTFGPLLGAIIISLLPAWLGDFSNYRQFIYGFILVLMILFAPKGAFALIEAARDRIFGGRR
jgi:branched-chain amino acid transport system permease protein